MLHTFFKVALLGALTASLSLADDFLARATNGALSDNSVGVKKLTADEASKVVGGYYVLGGKDGNYLTLANMRSGSTSFSQIGAVVIFTDFERTYGTSCGLDSVRDCSGNVRYYHAQSAYREVASIADQTKGEYLTITASKTTVSGFFGVPQHKFATSAIVIGVYGDKVYKLRNASMNGRIATEVKRAYENTLNGYLITRF